MAGAFGFQSPLEFSTTAIVAFSIQVPCRYDSLMHTHDLHWVNGTATKQAESVQR